MWLHPHSYHSTLADGNMDLVYQNIDCLRVWKFPWYNYLFFYFEKGELFSKSLIWALTFLILTSYEKTFCQFQNIPVSFWQPQRKLSMLNFDLVYKYEIFNFSSLSYKIFLIPLYNKFHLVLLLLLKQNVNIQITCEIDLSLSLEWNHKYDSE